MADKETVDPTPKAPAPAAKRVVGHQISIIGKGSHKVGGKSLKKGESYKASDLPKVDMGALAKDPHVVIEPIDKNGKVIVSPPGEDLEDEDSE